MDRLFDFLTIISWFWLVLGLGVLGIMYKNYSDGRTRQPGLINRPLPWVVVVTVTFSWLLVSL